MFSLAFKNILFYKSRAITTFILTFISTLLFIVYVALMDGSHGAMLKNALKVYTGSVEIYKKGYREVGGNDYLLENTQEIKEKLSSVKGIEQITSRYETYGLLSYKDLSSASMLAGIYPDQEKKISLLKASLIKGRFLENNDSHCMYIGEVLGKKLDIKLGETLSFIGSASDNAFVADLFAVCGIFRTGAYGFDASSAFVTKKYLDILMNAKNKSSYLTIKVKHLDEVDKIKRRIEKVLDNKEIEVLTWKTLMKSMVEMMKVDSIFGYISISLLFVVIFFVIMIFGFINMTSRLREFGTLRAIGLSTTHLNMLLFWEIFILSSLAILFATPLGGYIAYHFSLYPIVIDGISETYKDYGIISDEIPLHFDILTIAWNIALIYLLNFLSIIYPLVYINKFTPIEASKHV